MFDKLRIESQLQELRNRWTKEPNNRKILELQAKCLKMALSKIETPEVDAFDYVKRINGNE